MKTIDYLWRLVATGLCFATFSLGGLMVTCIAVPLSRMKGANAAEKKRLARQTIHKSFRFFTSMMSFLGVVEFDTRDVERELTKYRGHIVIANHPSLIDVVGLIAIMPYADCIIKEKLFDNVFFGKALKAAGYIKNSGNIDELISACKSSLNEGYSLIIFPEGTRTVPNQEITLQRGASNIALRCGVNLVSVFIRCIPTTLTKSESWYSIPDKKICLSMRMGESIDITHFQQGNQSQPIRARRLTAHLKEHLIEGLNCYD